MLPPDHFQWIQELLACPTNLLMGVGQAIEDEIKQRGDDGK